MHLLQSYLSSCMCCGYKVLHSQGDSPAIVISHSSGLHTVPSFVFKASHCDTTVWFFARLNPNTYGSPSLSHLARCSVLFSYSFLNQFLLNRGWDVWMASPTQWTWVWAKFCSLRWTGKPGMPQPMGLEKVRHDWDTELNWSWNVVDLQCCVSFRYAAKWFIYILLVV